MSRKWTVFLVVVAGLVTASCGKTVIGPVESDRVATTQPQPEAGSSPMDAQQLSPTGEAAARPPVGTRNGTTEKASVPLPAYDIVTLLPRDAIPAIFDPEFVSGEQADALYSPDELVLGVEIDGDARAYSIPYLSGREIVNDTVGGHPIAVTW